MIEKMTKARAVKIATTAAIALSLMAPLAARAETSNYMPASSGKPVEFHGGPAKERTTAIQDCRANDQTYGAAVKAAEVTYRAAIKSAAEARKTALQAAKALTNKEARKAAKHKAEADYRAAVKTAKEAFKTAKEVAAMARAHASGCVKGSRTGGIFDRMTALFRF